MAIGIKTWAKDSEKLQQLLRAIRNEAELTQIDLAQKLNTDQATISKIEKGIRRLDILELRTFCAACGVDIETFVSRLNHHLSK